MAQTMQNLIPVLTAMAATNQMSGQFNGWNFQKTGGPEAVSQPGTVTSDRRAQRAKRKPGTLASQYGAETTVLTDKLGA